MEMEGESGRELGLKSTSAALTELVHNLKELERTRNHVQMGNLKFESLCHAVAASVRDAANLMAAAAGEYGAPLRQRSLEARKSLLECATGIVENAGHPFKAFTHFDRLGAVCAAALTVQEESVRAEVEAAAKAALQALDTLEKSPSYENLFANVKMFGTKLHELLQSLSTLIHELRLEKSRSGIVSRTETVKKLLPLIIQSLRDSLRHPMNSHTRSSREYFFGIVRSCIGEISELVKTTSEGLEVVGEVRNADVGLFVKKLDGVMDFLGGGDDNDHFERFHEDVEWLVRFSLSVAKVSRKRSEEEEVIEASREALRCAAELRASSDSEATDSELRDSCRDAVEVLEQTVNNCLLKLIIELFCTSSANSPLDDLIHRILNSTVSPPDRLPEDVDDLVDAFDDHADTLFHVAHYTAFCTTDAKRSMAVATSLQLMQQLEKEVVPACLRLYFNPDDHGARSHLKALRTLWTREVEAVEAGVLGIVDATAFCYVANEEARAVAGLIKKEQYSQDKLWLRSHGTKLVKICQRAVDFAWKDSQPPEENAEDEVHALPDDHPVVKVERGTWEVQAALRMVLGNIEDLNLHKTLLRRVQVLTTCIGVMAHFLLSKNETAMSPSKVKVLTSISRIMVNTDDDIEENAAATKSVGGSESKGEKKDKSGVGRNKSFRNVKRKESFSVSKRARDTTVDGTHLSKTLAQICRMGDTELPFDTRKMQSDSRRRGDSESEGATLGFSEIFDQLSALSRDISRNLHGARDSAEQRERAKRAKEAAHANSLRQMAMKNAKLLAAAAATPEKK